jgi:hypothetical protein
MTCRHNGWQDAQGRCGHCFEFMGPEPAEETPEALAQRLAAQAEDAAEALYMERWEQIRERRNIMMEKAFKAGWTFNSPPTLEMIKAVAEIKHLRLSQPQHMKERLAQWKKDTGWDKKIARWEKRIAARANLC